MEVEITLPNIGEDEVTDATLALWHVDEGALVNEGDDLIELTTDKAAFTLPSPRTGRLLRRLKKEGVAIAIGDVLCVMEV